MLSLLFLAALLCYLYFWFWLWRGWRRLRPAKGQAQPFVSVVIAAHNEAENLPALLAALQSQSYPEYLREFIVIDDRSIDGTHEVLEEWKKRLQFRSLRIDSVPDGVNPKKNALAAGIRQARGEVIVMTDADCMPPPRWLESMARVFEKNVGAAVGVSPWYAEGKHWCEMIALESFATTIVSLAGVGHGRPFLAVGRNFAFCRELFERVGGYDSDMHIFSGDDDLLLQKICALPAVRIAAVFSEESIVPSRGAENLRAFISQKRRHISSSKAYPRPVQIAYAIYHLSNLVLWLSPFFLGLIGLGFLLLKLFVDGLIFHYMMRHCRLEISWKAFVPWEALFLFTHIFVGSTSFAGHVHWKS